MKTNAIVVGAAACLMAASGSLSSASAESSRPVLVTAQSMGYEVTQESKQQQIPWRIEVNSSGGETVTTGPGVATKPLSKDTVRYAQDVPRESVQAASSWVCEYHANAATTLKGNYLDSYIGNACTGRPGTQQLQWWFDHDNWYGWSQYSHEKHETSWTPNQAIGTPVSARCNKGKGIYNYWAVMKAQYKLSGPVVGVSVAHTKMGRFNCGKSEL